MKRKDQIKLEVLKLLRKDRTKEYTTGDLEVHLDETTNLEVTREEAEEVLEEYRERGVVHLRSVGHVYGEVYAKYGLIRREDDIGTIPYRNELESRELDWIDELPQDRRLTA